LRAKTKLVICSGNHDLDSKSEIGEKIARWLGTAQNEGVPSDGESFLLDDTLFTICPWWDGPVTRARIAEQLSEAAARRSGRWTWIHHAPPDKSPISWGGARYFGDVELTEWIGRFEPDIVLSGHVHQSPFVQDGSWVDRIGKTWVFNAGQELGPIPPHIIIDTKADEALWFSSAGVQSVCLGAPLMRPVAQLSAPPDWLKAGDQPRVQGQR
jgi:hypothetical protein